MGFTAPSAEEVYRYAFRVDNKERSLTDRFGFSIVFVNDTSNLCRSFLQNYCIDLCFRTSNRIRFIFFSELPNTVFQKILHNIQGRKLKGGMLGNILSLIGKEYTLDSKSPLNFEHEIWRNLQPKSLKPLYNLDEIEQHLNWECDMWTAMPGANMAMQFAQKLGIGRFIPCILIFNDIGKLQVDMMPVSNMSPKEIYSHIRGWIDEFYEINQTIIQRWSIVENDIVKLCKNTNKSLDEIRNWHDSAKDQWDTLRYVSSIIWTFENAEEDEWQRTIIKLRDDNKLPNKVQKLIKEYMEKLRKINEIFNIEKLINTAITLLNNSEGPNSVYETLMKIREEILIRPKDLCPKSIVQALDKLNGQNPTFKAPCTELELWLLINYEQIFVRKKIVGFLKYWFNLIGMNVFNDDAIKLVIESLNPISQPIDIILCTDKIIYNLENNYSVNIDSKILQREHRNLKNQISKHLRELIESFPEWLFQEDLLSINLPTYSNQRNISLSLDEFFILNPKVKDILKKHEKKNRKRISVS